MLGPVRVRLDDEPVAVTGAIRQGLLALLLVRANEPVSADSLAEALWRDDSANAAQRLQVHVHKLRRQLDDPARLSFEPGGYCMRVLPGELDAVEFGTLLDEASELGEHDPSQCAGLIRKAMSMWRGEPFQGLDIPELAGEIHRLTERRLMALEQRYAAELRSGKDAELVGELSDLSQRNPLRERPHGLLMTALYQAGRPADALAAYRRAREVMVEEVGLEPGPELRALEARILAGESLSLENRPGPRVVPAQLPHNIAGFVGRESQLSQLDQLLAGGGESAPIVGVGGTAGVGKTALAVPWAHRVKDRFPDGQLYVDLRGYGPDQPLAPEDALAGFLRALGVDGTGIPHGLSERSARFRSLLDQKRVLVVLDNVGTADQVRPLLPGTSSCFVLVTSRDSLSGLAAREGARRIDLDRMTVEEATGLLADLLPEPHTDLEASERLIERCARLPLALRIAAERIKERRGHRLADLVDELADEQTRLDALDVGDVHASVRAVFSWSYHQLPADAARLFRCCGLHRGHDIDRYALTALLGNDDIAATGRLLDTLVRANLLDETTEHRYQLHDLLWTYATELTERVDTETEREAALRRLLDYYLHTASTAMRQIAPYEEELWEPVASPLSAAPDLPDYEAGFAWLDAERSNLVRAAISAAASGLPSYAIRLSAVLWLYLDLGWHLDDGEHLHRTALAVARDRGEAVAEAFASRALGMLSYRTSQHVEAERYLEAALGLQDRAGAWLAKAETLNALGALYGHVGRIDEAIQHLEKSVELHRSLGSQVLVQRPLCNLGLLHRRCRRYEAAFECLHEALTIADEVGSIHGQAHALYGLAGAYRDTDQCDDALRYAQRFLSLSRKSGLRGFEGIGLHRLGSIYRRLGDYERARHHHDEALLIARATSHQPLEAMALNGSAQAYAAAGATAEAARCYAEALAVAAEAGLPYEQARAYAGLAQASADRGDREEAAELWRRALDLYQELRAPEAAEIAAKLAG